MKTVSLSTSGTIIGLFVASVALSGLMPSQAQAQAPEISDEEIDQLFITAAEAFKVGRYREALGALTRISEINPDPLILFNIARCHEELGELKEAEAAFVRALKAELPDSQRQETRERLKNIRAVIEKAALEEEERQRKTRGDDEKPIVNIQPTQGEGPRVLLALHAGMNLPQAFSALESAPSFGLEVAYVLPYDVGPFTSPVELSFGLAFSKPGSSGSGFDSGLGDAGADFDWTLEQRSLHVDLGLAWRFSSLSAPVSIYVQTGPRFYLIESILDASEGGVGFGVQRETNSEAGFFVAGGADLKLGPGSVFGALEISGRGVDDSLAENTNTGALAFDIGYRVHF